MRTAEEYSSAVALAGRRIATTSASSPIRVPGPAVVSAPAPSSIRNAPRWTTKPESASSPCLNKRSPRTTSRCSEPIASMRKASLPNKRNVGTRSNRTTSSSIDIQTLGPGTGYRGRFAVPNLSRHQLVATGFRHQDLGVGGVLLDLLTQPVDVRLERVGGDARIVTPHFLQQGFTRHR